MAAFVDTAGDQHRRIQHLAALADLLVLRIKDNIAIAAQIPAPPGREHLVELGGGSGDLRRGDLRAAQLLNDALHPPRGHTLHIHLGNRQQQGALRTQATAETLRIKLTLAGLRHLQRQRAQARLQRLVLVAVGVTTPIRTALVKARPKVFAAFGYHRRVQQHRHRLCQSIEAMRLQQFNCLANRSILVVSSHSVFPLVCKTPISLSRG